MSVEKDKYSNRKTRKKIRQYVNKRNTFGKQVQKVYSASLIMTDM